MRRKWITDPKALDTICALGLPMGSEVMLDWERGQEIDIFPADPGGVLRAVPMDRDDMAGKSYIDGGGRRRERKHIMLNCMARAERSKNSHCDEWYISREVIAAWRPAKLGKK